MLFEKLFKPPKKVLSLESRRQSPIQHQAVDLSVETNVQKIIQSLGNQADLVVHYLTGDAGIYGAVMYLSSLTNSKLLSEQVIKPLKNLRISKVTQTDIPFITNALTVSALNKFSDLKEATDYLLSGGSLLFLQGAEDVLAFCFPGFPKRQVQESITEQTLEGAKEGLTEVINDNIAMIRRWIKDPNLQVEKVFIGERTNTETVVMYLKDVANPDIVSEVHQRLKKIKIDGIVESGYISELISDNRLTLFPLVQETERPDKVVAALLEGRVAILVDQSPFAIIVPVTSAEFYQTPADFYYNYWVATFFRFLRAFGTLTAITLPGLYLAVLSVNPELAPPRLIQVISSGRVQIPFPLLVETLITLLILEIFREASVRIPANINLILGIAGGILMGLGAIESGLVSGTTLVIAFLTTLASFSTANNHKEQAWRLVRYFLLFAGGTFGILGLTLAGLVVLTHLATLKSFGISYLGPWAPPQPVDMIDAFFRLPWWLSHRRPPIYRPQQEDRMDNTLCEDEK